MIWLNALVAFAVAHAYDVLPDTDFSNNRGDSNLPGGSGSSALDCAKQCSERYQCVAVSWNGPSSPIHDGACNFKCRIEAQVRDKGEEGVVVRPGEDRCHHQLPSNCTEPMPSDWLEPCLEASLFPAPLGLSALMPDLANGYVGYVAQSSTVHAAGLFNGDAVGQFGPASHRADIPRPTVTLGAPSSDARATAGTAESTGQAMDIARAVFIVRTTHSAHVSVEQRWYAHATRASLLVHEIEVQNTGQQGASLLLDFNVAGSTSDLALSLCSAGPGELCLTGQNRVPEDALTPTGGNHTTISIRSNSPCPHSNTNCTATPMQFGPGVHTLYYVTAIVSSLNSSQPSVDAQRFLSEALHDPRQLLPEHEAAWHNRWSRGSIRVEGDLRLAQAVNASLYVIRASIRDDWPYGLSPGGLTTNGYNGHSFWDVETWMWPPLLMLDPPSAVSALAYRWNRRGMATQKASQCGKPNHAWCPSTFKAEHDMMMFPWESAFTGQEVQFSGGKIGPWGEYEQHISGDISFAARQYFYATQDLQWLKQVGFPLIRGIASFYAARLQPSSNSVGRDSSISSSSGDVGGGDTYVFNEVMGPDEYAYPVNNSAYTNTVASLALAAAVEFAPLVGASVPAEWALKASGLRAATAAVPSGSGLVGEYHPEYAGYPNGAKGAKVKQADTVMLSYPFGVQMSSQTLSNDLTWYEPQTDVNGPAMTWAVFAIGWFDTGNYTHAQSRFRQK